MQLTSVLPLPEPIQPEHPLSDPPTHIHESVLLYMNWEHLDYKSLLFQHFYPFFKAKHTQISLHHKLPLLALRIKPSSSSPITDPQDPIHAHSLKAIPEMKRFFELLVNNPLCQSLFVKTIEEIHFHNLDNSVFHADKLVTLSGQNPLAVYLLAESFFQKRDFIQITYLFHKHNLLFTNENFKNLSAESYLRLNNYEKCLKVLNTPLKNCLYSQAGKNPIFDWSFLFPQSV